MEGLTLDLNESSQICAQSLLVRSKPMQSRTWLQKWKRDSWTQLLYGRILKPSHGESFVEKWTSSLEASLVNPSQLQDVEKEMKIQDTFSPTSSKESNFSDLPLFSLRTLKGSSPLNSEKDGLTPKERPFCFMYLGSWKEWIIKQRQEYLVRLKSELLINGSESLSWASPIKEDYKRRGPNSRQQGLPNQVKTSSQVEEEKIKKSGNLPELFPTPTANEHKYRLKGTSQASQNLNAIHRGQLNPRWVETLMAVPIGWTMATCVNPYVIERTNSDSLVTESSPQQRKEPSESYGKNSTLLLDFVKIAEQEIYPFVRLDNLNSCIIGLNECCRIVYSYSKMIDHFNKYMTLEESVDWILVNIAPLESPRSFDISYDLE